MEASLLLRQLLKAREIKVDVGPRMKFTLVRPTEMELIRMRGPDGKVNVGLLLVQEKCNGWEGVIESDIVAGGASDPVAFDLVLYQQWIADRPDLWPEMFEKFTAAIEAHRDTVEAVKGN